MYEPKTTCSDSFDTIIHVIQFFLQAAIYECGELHNYLIACPKIPVCFSNVILSFEQAVGQTLKLGYSSL